MGLSGKLTSGAVNSFIISRSIQGPTAAGNNEIVAVMRYPSVVASGNIIERQQTRTTIKNFKLLITKHDASTADAEARATVNVMITPGMTLSSVLNYAQGNVANPILSSNYISSRDITTDPRNRIPLIGIEAGDNAFVANMIDFNVSQSIGTLAASGDSNDFTAITDTNSLEIGFDSFEYIYTQTDIVGADYTIPALYIPITVSNPNLGGIINYTLSGEIEERLI